MKTKKAIITQSNYIPWKGYFDAIELVDEVILFDDMQYTRRDWRNRNKIKTPQGLKWLTIPVEVKGKYFQPIKDTKISELNWNKKHWKTIQYNYAKAPYFEELKDPLENLYLSCNYKFLSEVNYHFLQGINELLNISTPLVFSSKFDLLEDKNERLISLCKQIQATDYYTGSSAKSYIDEILFNQEGIKVHYLDYSEYPEYYQQYPPFNHFVSILDLLLNTGTSASEYMKNF